jgi:hypothetical protein
MAIAYTLAATEQTCAAAAACVQVVRQLLGVLLSLLDRLAAMQLAMAPPSISGRFTGEGGPAAASVVCGESHVSDTMLPHKSQ